MGHQHPKYTESVWHVGPSVMPTTGSGGQRKVVQKEGKWWADGKKSSVGYWALHAIYVTVYRSLSCHRNWGPGSQEGAYKCSPYPCGDSIQSQNASKLFGMQIKAKFFNQL